MSRLLEIWPGVMAHASGGLWLESSRTLALADLHLGYGWAQRRRGELGPLADAETRTKLLFVLDELSPSKVLLVGDIVHAPKPGKEEFAFVESVLSAVIQRTELVAIRGNHDRQFARDFDRLGIVLVEEWRDGSLTVTHGDHLPNLLSLGERLVIGHLHPAIALEDPAGVKRRIPAFFVSGPVVVLPAFSPFAVGVDIWRSMPVEIARLNGGAIPEAIAATGARVVKLGSLNRLVSPTRGSRPSDFRV